MRYLDSGIVLFINHVGRRALVSSAVSAPDIALCVHRTKRARYLVEVHVVLGIHLDRLLEVLVEREAT
eukprot:2085160-Rhodomonas_salina.1